MKHSLKSLLLLTTACLAGLFMQTGTASASASSAAGLTADGKAALRDLYKVNPDARAASKHAVAVLVFPNIVKAGFIAGAHRGDGVLFDSAGRSIGYYNTTAGSFGLQAGVQKFGYALFFMSKKSMMHLHGARSWELGSTPNIVLVKKGGATSINTSQVGDKIYGFFFDTKGLMAGVDVNGSKITEIHPK